jgi:mono/diheme cytochrome c family protein
MFLNFIFSTFLISSMNFAIAADNAYVKSRGELLYSTHCISCHNTQMHWRDSSIVKNWIGLKMQVRRWEEVSGLDWQDEDIEEVARYLNVMYYHYPLSKAQSHAELQN